MEGVYFIQNAVTGNIKIGHATNVSARLGQMQTGSDCELVLLYFMETHFPAAQEGEFHRRFDFCRIRGEWFKCEGDLKEFLKEKLGGQEKN